MMIPGDKNILIRFLILNLVDVEAIKAAGFTVAIDCINSVGGIILPQLLRSLGVDKIIELNTIPDGNFAHNPEPLPENLKGYFRTGCQSERLILVLLLILMLTGWH